MKNVRRQKTYDIVKVRYLPTNNLFNNYNSNKYRKDNKNWIKKGFTMDYHYEQTSEVEALDSIYYGDMQSK